MTKGMQIAERVGIFDPGKFRGQKQRECVFTTMTKMLERALPDRR